MAREGIEYMDQPPRMADVGRRDAAVYIAKR
jgi:hypothetical protein